MEECPDERTLHCLPTYVRQQTFSKIDGRENSDTPLSKPTSPSNYERNKRRLEKSEKRSTKENYKKIACVCEVCGGVKEPQNGDQLECVPTTESTQDGLGTQDTDMKNSDEFKVDYVTGLLERRLQARRLHYSVYDTE